MSSGKIIIGNVGSEQKKNVQLTGRLFYKASRLEKLNKVKNTKFLATVEFINHVSGLKANFVGKEELRGIGDLFEIFEIISIDPSLPEKNRK